LTSFDDIPELIEPIVVTIQQFDEANTVTSAGLSGRHELLNVRAELPPFTLPAQVAFGDNSMKPEFQQIGVDEQAAGYLVLRFIDVQNAGVTLKRGDKITKLGQLDVEYYLLHTLGDPAAHFSSQGGFTLFRMFFADRNPAGS